MYARKWSLIRAISVLLLMALSLALFIPTALADDIHQTQGFRNQVTLAGIREHQAAFQSHSDANGGNRVAGSPGYEASANYVVAKLQAAGYTVTSQNFPFLFNADATPPVFTQVSPASASYVDGVDFASMT